MIITFDQIVKMLRKYKGQFEDFPYIGIRHKTERCEDKSFCCPLAFLSKMEGYNPRHNLDKVTFERALKANEDLIYKVIRVADENGSSDKKLLLEACC